MPRTNLSLSITVFLFLSALITGDPNVVLGGLATGLFVTLFAYRKDLRERAFYGALVSACEAHWAKR
jgi:hypothetical protein